MAITLSCDGNTATFDFGDGRTAQAFATNEAGTDRVIVRLPEYGVNVVDLTSSGGNTQVRDLTEDPNAQIFP